MNKAQLVEAIADKLGGRQQAADAVDAVLDAIVRAVVAGDRVSVTGFGSFEKVDRPARYARNPQTGERVRVKKTSVPRFRAGQGFKDLVSGSKKLPKNDVAVKKAPKGSLSGGTKTTAKAAAKKATAKKATAKKATTATTAKKTTAKTAVKKTTTAAAKKATATTKKAAAKKATPAKKTTAAATKAAAAKKATPAKKTTATAKKATAKKTAPAAKKATATKAPARKTTARKTTAKKAAAKK
ncbi:HU family DNA-binding protein [Streptomyces albireticuli]|uniref:DNA-binding protein HU 2 n=1 Tax=Streptomyces albireticuli TaxID=1940 RepID=A0A1Z2L0D5_9ACTN|nr:HU family DNA-binding protein [Streptomyces albireticuli]ARZ67661.1 DNA-binding protein [Streptomyces albireticuli]MCD9144118.1 HU family DNA-binding protein [Streptomyces albireticuli]MCD9162239.1 HU family DNA-binding protein [Streptomyces albireticuli]MCD9195592.1 HU family DNA-binding protein [Streptomyces albireticuli]PAU48476.1 HU family DNA-binding protein [Streptomyces albireticuli]